MSMMEILRRGIKVWIWIQDGSGRHGNKRKANDVVEKEKERKLQWEEKTIILR